MKNYFLSILIFLFPLFMLNSCNSPAGTSDGQAKAGNNDDTGDYPESDDEAATAAQSLPRDLRLGNIIMPPGFTIDVYATVPNARSMTLSPQGTLFVGTRKDKVYAVVDRTGNRKADEVIVIAENLNSPNGVAFRNGSLYVGEIHRVIRYDEIETNLKHALDPVVVTDKFPTDKHHAWKFMKFGPDGKLYAPVGAPCNICYKEEPIYSSITRMNPDGSDFEIFAHGVRNTVGFDWHPETDELWFTDNGADRMGDNMPADELNVAPRKGMHFGFPFCHGGSIPDPEHGKGRSCDEFVSPVKLLGPHVAALGMRFNKTGKMFPEKFQKHIFIAEHGSWDRTVPLGYRIMIVTLEGSEVVSYAPFAEGWLGEDGKAWGRPVDVEFMDDGSMLVSDDEAGVIYRISYTNPS
jgi:glucose/arabinose dehydrogenase